MKNGVKLESQEIDSYGKCRALIFTYKREIGTFLTTPIQPLLLPSFKGKITPRLSLNTAIDLMGVLNLNS